jgi:hypothetical protein
MGCWCFGRAYLRSTNNECGREDGVLLYDDVVDIGKVHPHASKCRVGVGVIKNLAFFDFTSNIHARTV